MRKILLFFLLLTIFASVTQCAFMDKKNRRITNYLDENLTPQTDKGRLLLAPVAIPTGTISLLSDTFVLQPLVAIPKALGDTVEYIWLNPEGGVVLQSFLFIPKVVFTPITLGVLWIRHALFK
ncbi:MAG: hypothetical protein JJT78_10770 [Leptospira sp.]|nr:hypothetical protein [Leptospira sp.]